MKSPSNVSKTTLCTNFGRSLYSIFLTPWSQIHANFLRKLSCLCAGPGLKIETLTLFEIFSTSPVSGEGRWKNFLHFFASILTKVRINRGNLSH